jgi:hypothetical protein
MPPRVRSHGGDEDDRSMHRIYIVLLLHHIMVEGQDNVVVVISTNCASTKNDRWANGYWFPPCSFPLPQFDKKTVTITLFEQNKAFMNKLNCLPPPASA